MEKKRKLTEYISLLESKGLISDIKAGPEELDKQVGYISYDSRDVREGTLFVCKGAHFSKEYLKGAISGGAFAYISEEAYELEGAECPHIIVNDMRKAMAYMAGLYYDNVWRRLKLIGITGTKGKSTTVYFMKYILDDYLEKSGKPKSAVISSIDTYDGVINEESHITTPEAMALHRHFYNAAESGIEFLSMEASSQGFKYDRTLGVVFDAGCFLNIDEDHISAIEHSDFEDYFSSKLLLFKQCRTACVNLGSRHLDRILECAGENAPKVITFGLREEADVYGYDVKVKEEHIAFRVRTPGFDREFLMSMRGLFNVENALAAISVCCALGIPEEHIFSGLLKARVGGRMEVFKSPGRDLTVIVDYAHNRMSFEALFLSTLKEYPGQKIAIVCGCPGYKALGRRRELAEIAGKYAGKAFITEEDPGEEPVMNICLEIAKYMAEQNLDHEIIVDREEAIKRAIDTAPDSSVVLVAAKGRETRQKRGLEYVETVSDVECVEKFLK